MNKFATLAVAVVGTLGAALASDAQAGTVYTYTSNTSTVFTLTLDVNKTSAELANLSSGTDISSWLTSFSFSGIPYGSDALGFPLEVNSTSAESFKIGTDTHGNITSWDIAASFFASYPAFPGENPNDFFCTYSLSSSGGGDSFSLTQDNDAGFCRGNFASRDAGKWTSTIEVAQTPLPAALPLFAVAVGGLGFAGYRRRAQETAA